MDEKAEDIEMSMSSLGEKIEKELDKRDRDYYHWSILRLIISLLPMIVQYPPWTDIWGGQQYLGVSYQIGQFDTLLGGYQPYVEMVWTVVTWILLGLVAKFYFSLVMFRDNLLNTSVHEDYPYG